ncbi:MAG: DUF1651 domain-containing protein [Cyanobacteria bacterium M_surface_10_m1_298]|nr:DUF1651 domain-containing protein [Cyanobacteria bacterium M_surface_10_m1_298]
MREPVVRRPGPQGQGWLQEPRSLATKRFHPDQKSWAQDPMVFVDSGRPLPGQPPLLKSRCYLHRDQAVELWGALLKGGWQVVSPQWGADLEL